MSAAIDETLSAASGAELRSAMVSKVRELRPRLLEEQAATEQRGAFSPEMHEIFQAEGLYRIQQPRRYGGHEFDVPAFLAVVREIARGCPGTAWCFSLSAGHHIQMAALFSEAVQDEIYGSVSDFLAPCRPVPMGEAHWEDGSWRVTGEWDYCSGAPYSTHALVMARLHGGPATQPFGLVVLPRNQWTMLDNWRGSVLGMAGSGSNTIRVENAVVPADHLVQGSVMTMPAGADSVGYKLHGNPLFCGQTAGYAQLEIAAILVGTARATADEYERLLRTKKTMGPSPQPRFTAGEHQRAFASATALTDAAEDVLEAAGQRFMDYCRDAVNTASGFSRADAGRTSMAANQAVDLAWQAVDLMFRMSGSSEGARNGARMQRYYRDFSMARTNMAPKLDMEAQAFAEAYFAN
ncbi:acyl-CoA dehydrogenase family protein [Nocardioides gilvus]|uniref:acyl-CoA dehydrogenase family protein n=1 Tax=Nocardioides gilvus TaxID=1735589 RepID=UPI0013A559F4|nr:acyl-CoA dehydrogenase family protein [Nocardioides gilvus]